MPLSCPTDWEYRSLPLFKGFQSHFGLEFRSKLSSCHISKFKFIFELNLLT